ncbi:hypothetical protein [Streptomyces iranensis]
MTDAHAPSAAGAFCFMALTPEVHYGRSLRAVLAFEDTAARVVAGGAAA